MTNPAGTALLLGFRLPAHIGGGRSADSRRVGSSSTLAHGTSRRGAPKGVALALGLSAAGASPAHQRSPNSGTSVDIIALPIRVITSPSLLKERLPNADAATCFC